MFEESEYYTNILKEMNLESCRPATTPGALQVAWKESSADILDQTLHSLYRRVVGKLQWVVPLRPYFCHTVKELARFLNEPTQQQLTRLKHLMRYVKGTLDYHFVIKKAIFNKNSICFLSTDGRVFIHGKNSNQNMNLGLDQ